MSRNEIYSRLLTLFGKLLKVQNRELTEKTALKDELGLDSVDLMDFAVMLEGEFDIEIGDYEATWINTVEDVIQLVQNKLSEKNPAS